MNAVPLNFLYIKESRKNVCFLSTKSAYYNDFEGSCDIEEIQVCITGRNYMLKYSKTMFTFHNILFFVLFSFLFFCFCCLFCFLLLFCLDLDFFFFFGWVCFWFVCCFFIYYYYYYYLFFLVWVWVCFLFCDQINAALLSIRDFFQIKTSYQP